MELNVEFGNVSVGDATARIGVKLVADAMDANEARRVFCGRQLWGRITLATALDEKQERLPGMAEERPHEIEAAMDVKSVGMQPKHYSFGLTFSLGGQVDVSVLAQFAKRAGRLVIDEIKDLPEKSAGSAIMDEDEPDDEPDEPDLFADVDEEQKAAYSAGCEASAEEKPRTANPHPVSTKLWVAWNHGWDSMNQYA